MACPIWLALFAKYVHIYTSEDRCPKMDPELRARASSAELTRLSASAFGVEILSLKIISVTLL
jgi:hypothetical protein